MSLAQALATAMTGLRTTQTGLSLVAGNVANAESPGYVRKTLLQSATSAGDFGLGVRVDGINRVLDQYLQSQFRTENAGGAYADLRSQYYQRLQGVYGAPGAEGGIESVYNRFTTALQSLSTSPDDYSARADVLSSAQALAQQLNQMTSDVQALRSDAEAGLSDSVRRANEAMEQIASLNRQLATTGASDAAGATLIDQRDRYVDELSRLIDIRVTRSDANLVNVFTSSGIQLVGSQASRLAFTPQGALTATTQWSADPQQRAVGTIVLTSPSGGGLDLINAKAIRSGEIAAYLEARDQILVQAQGQLDEMAAAMARSLSDRTVDGTPATSGAQTGFDLDIGGLSDGNTVSFSYTDTVTGQTHRITLMQVSDPDALPLKDTATADPNDRVIGIDATQGMPAVLASLNSRFNGRIVFGNPSGTMLRILDDGAANNTDVTSANATVTATSLAGGSAELPFFTDVNDLFSGAITGQGSQTRGFAGRIAVNPALLADPTRLVAYQAGVAGGDGLRPDFLSEQLTKTPLTFSPDAGIGTSVSPFAGSLPAYLQQMLSQQGAAANAAAQLQQGQSVVVSALQQRISDESGVNIDNEMAHLLQLQNAYAANARVLSTVKSMLEALMNI
jgi:flagellar hook-associated protein 1 FlgK